MAEKKPFLCRLGYHRRPYSDSAMFTSALRCGVCNEWLDPIAGVAVDVERKAWEAGTVTMPEGEAFNNRRLSRQKATMSVIDLGQIAYDAYGEHRGWKVVGGGPMPTWDDQSEELRDAWRAAAEAVAQHTRTARSRH